MAQVIGFAETFFTLWERTEESHYINGYLSHITYRYSYVKNISTSLEAAKEAYPNADIDLELRGFTHVRTEKAELPDEYYNIFRFGRYKGLAISDCTDTGYLIWFARNAEESKARVIADSRLTQLGYTYIQGEGYERLELAEAYKEFVASLVNGVTLKVLIDRNTNEYGEMFINAPDSERGSIIVFPEVVECLYHGQPYYLPAKNGKGKRIRGKFVRLSVKDNRVTDFEIVK